MSYDIKQICDILQTKCPILHAANISILLTDSRSLCFPEESLFFALTTNKNDGHNYINELYKKGVRNFVVNKSYSPNKELKDANFIIVDNTLDALQALARFHRRQVKIPVVGITGSNGKTVVKEWLYQLLSPSKKVVRSPRSYNSQIGVPLSVWQIDSDSDIAIFEAGISMPGEMEKIESIIMPTIGVLTNIGESHQENFDHLRQKTDEKLELFQHCDILIYNADSPIIQTAISEALLSCHEIGWSRKNRECPVYIADTVQLDNTTRINYEYLGIAGSFEIPFIDGASIEDAIHCLCVILYLGVSYQDIAQRMAALEPVAMRMEIIDGNKGCLLINDSYNSDVNSLDIALDFQARRRQNNMSQTLILSDILQTGLLPKTLYRKVSESCSRKGVNKIIGIGKDLYNNQHQFNINGHFFKTTNDFLKSGLIDTFENEIILIKGSRRFNFEYISELLTLKKHETILEINLDSIIHNFNHYKSFLKPSTQMICMVKADGYGAGAIEISKTLQNHGCDYFAVALADEGVELREHGIHSPIMVMNPEQTSFKTIFKHNLEPEVYSFRLLKSFIHQAERLGITGYPIHIKVDTGMHRLGFMPDDIDQLIDLIKAQNTVIVKSVFSHLAGSDNPDLDDFTLQQIKKFSQFADKLQASVQNKINRHILNSAGIERFSKYQFDMVRLGIGLYGVNPSPESKDLHTVSQLRSTILQIKEIEAGESIGYNRNGKTIEKTTIGIIPIGYGDGFDRRWGNGVGQVIVNGKRCPTIGNICMDTTMIDLTGRDAKEGDKVIIFGPELSLDELAKKLQTIPYEIITSIASRVKKVYFQE